MKVKITKFIEFPGGRWCLDRVIDMPKWAPLHAGLVLDGVAGPGIETVVDKVIFRPDAFGRGEVFLLLVEARPKAEPPAEWVMKNYIDWDRKRIPLPL